MSHYAVAVFCNSPDSDDFDELLDPYGESLHLVFTPVPEAEIRKRFDDFMNHSFADLTYEKYVEMYYDSKLDDNGKTVYGYYENPNAKWDYYSLDGKDYMFDPLEGHDMTTEGFYRKSDIDWYKETGTPEREEELHLLWKKYIIEGDGFYNSDYYHLRYGTEEQFVKEAMRPPFPYAFITPDGKWHAPGNIGWFALSDETAESMDAYYEEFKDFIDNAPDCYVSLVDCHI